ncbi:MAG: hypothetical protein H6624_14560 [Bdellovibrionaceae bacterium]|nr:hypothetical protein [Bdellovibrionales bacterium]MCB9085566.1 hypothetical protein [Pseudobdellovibrionaceae bacterium]
MGFKESLETTKAMASGAELEPQSVVATHFVRPAYHEIPEAQSEQVDVLAQMKANLDQLEDIQGRLRFVMGEIRSITRK